MKEVNVVNGYVETLYKSIHINEKVEIRVLTSEYKEEMLIDIRKYSLYGNAFDYIKRPTKKGIKFKLQNINEIIKGLIMILVDHNMLERNVGTYILDLLDANVHR